ncbi:HAD family hydrolase [Halobacteriales archaeon QS_8_69_26]|nr:MAG: HAD family hydrolase [Halobacteriales archaeon QS_8_69_26]
MPATEAVCFDLDDTLCVPDVDDAELHAAAFDRVDADPFFTWDDVNAVDPHSLPTAGTLEGFFENLFRRVAADVGGDPAHAPALAEATAAVLDDADPAFREGAQEALRYARDRYEVALVTQGPEDRQSEKLEALGIADAFDATVFCASEPDLAPKPDPAPFRRALADLDAAAAETVHVGDSLRGDVAGAHGAGLHSAWVPTGPVPEAPDPEPTYLLDSPGDLPEVL